MLCRLPPFTLSSSLRSSGPLASGLGVASVLGCGSFCLFVSGRLLKFPVLFFFFDVLRNLICSRPRFLFLPIVGSLPLISLPPRESECFSPPFPRMCPCFCPSGFRSRYNTRCGAPGDPFLLPFLTGLAPETTTACLRPPRCLDLLFCLFFFRTVLTVAYFEKGRPPRLLLTRHGAFCFFSSFFFRVTATLLDLPPSPPQPVFFFFLLHMDPADNIDRGTFVPYESALFHPFDSKAPPPVRRPFPPSLTKG